MTAPARDFMDWTWADIEPRYRELDERRLDTASVHAFLRDWSTLAARLSELSVRLRLATDRDTADEEASARFREFVQEVEPKIAEAENRLQRKLLTSGLEPAGMKMPIRRMRVDTELFREENLPLASDEAVLVEEYFKIAGAQTVEWDGREIPLAMLLPVMEEQDRERRERAWRAGASRRLQDREAIDEIWRKLLDLRRRQAANAGFPDYLSYRWQALHRFDYTPEDAQRFHTAVERVVVPAVVRRFERRRQRLGLPSIRPWDRDVDVFGRPPVHPYATAAEWEETTAGMFDRVDRALGGYFETMRREGLLDLESRANKSPGAYCAPLAASARAFILGNAAGVHDDIVMLLHESGHAFHVFETAHLPYEHQRDVPTEFAEVASMSMELLASPYLPKEAGGFYSREDAARVRLAHLEQVLALLPWSAAIDSFQHWLYQHPEEAGDTQRMEEVWAGTVRRFQRHVDWNGLESELRNDWRRILHIFAYPLYFLEYALAQLGAIQVWANARRDQGEAVRRYREALALGGTKPLPELFATAGVRFAFDEQTLQEVVDLVEGTMGELDAEQAAAVD